MSVCTGSAPQLSPGCWMVWPRPQNDVFELARSQGDKVDWQESARWVDAGQYVTLRRFCRHRYGTCGTERVFDAELAEQVMNYTEHYGIVRPMQTPSRNCYQGVTPS